MVSNLPDNPYQSFIESRKAKGISPASLSYYQIILSRALSAIGNPYLAEPADITAYLNTIPPNKHGFSTRHAYRRVLRTFYGWLSDVYDLPNPIPKVPAPELPNVILPTLRLNQVKDLVRNQSTRAKAIIMLATASGLRRSELANVKIEDLDLQEGKIRTNGKGRKEAYAPISFAKNYVEAWILESGKRSGSLFDLNTHGMQSFFARLEKQTGLKTNAHVFRRTFAVIGRELGLSDLTIKDLGRWNSVDMVQRYTRDFSFDDANKQLKQSLSKLGDLFSAC
jgi:integrase